MMRTLLSAIVLALVATSCVPTLVRREVNVNIPTRFTATIDSTSTSNIADSTSTFTSLDTITAGTIDWRTFYADSNLVALIDTAVQHNQELQSVMQEVLIAQNEVDAKSGEYLPFVNLRAGAGIEKSGRHTRNGVVEEQLEVGPGEHFPEPLPNFTIGAEISWEVDIWRKLRNASDASAVRYLATIEGTRFLVTNIVAELAASYYELMALDNLLAALDTNLQIQRNALQTIEYQKQAAQATELAVKKFEAEVAKNEGHRFEVVQRITETENHINVLMGRYPQHMQRSSNKFLSLQTDSVHAGLPPQLLENRPDVKQAALDLKAADLDIAVAKARFYPSLSITAGVGYQAFNPKYLFSSPESMIYDLAGELLMPVINRSAIKSAYFTAGAHQVQAAYDYERTVLNAYVEVANQLSNINNLRQGYARKTKQVEALSASVDIANSLFTSARANYLEVLMTQRDALEAKMELIETKVQQMRAHVNVYRALGGGWK